MKRTILSVIMLASLSTSVLAAPDNLTQAITWTGTVPSIPIIGAQGYIKDLSLTGLGSATLTFTRNATTGALIAPTQSISNFEVLAVADDSPITHTVALINVTATMDGVTMPTGSWVISRNGTALTATPTAASTVSSDITITTTPAGLALLDSAENAQVIVTANLAIAAGV